MLSIIDSKESLGDEMEATNTAIKGLTQKQVEERIKNHQKNSVSQSITKTHRQIYKENICTLFNLLNILIALALVLVQAWSNLFFLAVIVCNIVIGILQELHAKKLVDNLSLLMRQRVSVMRDGVLCSVDAQDLVVDDVMVLSSGEQILCDAVLLQGEAEINEALLSGESDPIHKRERDQLLSGSSIISGKCYAQVVHVGADNYANRIANEVKEVRAVNSRLLNAMKRVTKLTGYAIIPLGILLFLEAWGFRGDSIQVSVITSSAALLGMLPKGLVLLISVSLAAGVSRMAKHKVLIQDLYSLETLANVDTLCLDKTGTITTGDLAVETMFPLCEETETDMDYIRSFLHYSDDNNATYQALCKQISPRAVYEPQARIPFSSLRKWSSAYFEGYGSLIMGAPEKLLENLDASFSALMEEGKRIVVLGKCSDPVRKDAPLPSIHPLYAVVFTDTIRPHVEKTLQYFREENVEIKIISGDHITAVSAIARQAGLHSWNACLDMSGIGDDPLMIDQLAEQYSVFGRVTPLQKKLLVQALQKKGHAVAMSGDGVNDMLALKEADCSIAIAQGSDAVKQMSQIVLLDSDFSALPMILKEGRRVVNNATRVAGVFFIKTIYSILLSILCILMNLPFPFIPIQITLIDLAIEAFPSFLTMLEPDHRRVGGDFLTTVLCNALPNAIAIVFSFLAIEFMSDGFSIRYDEAVTMMYLCVTVISMLAVYHSSRPLNRLRALICFCMTVGFILAILLFHELLHITLLSLRLLVLTAILALSAVVIRQILMLLLPWIPGLRPQQKGARQHSLS